MRIGAIIGSFIIISIFATALFASAASLNVNGGTLGAGNDNVASCDTDGVNVNWATQFVQNLLAFRVTNVTVSGIDDEACAGADMTVVLTDLNNNILGELTTTVGGASQILDFTSIGNILASLVSNAYVVITGPSAP